VNGPETYTESANGWLDNFDHGLTNATIGEGYRVFEIASGRDSLFRSQHFRSNNHWMVDIAGHDQNGGPPWNHGGSMMRPDRTFRFENGRLMIEADVAAGIQAYGVNAWPEIDISTAPAPTGVVVDNGYGYGQFGGDWAMGIRLQPGQRAPIAALYRPDGIRTFEISFFQDAGAHVFGGGPFSPAQDAAWGVCRSEDPDIVCRDRFRWEITRDTLTLYVNGVKYMEHSGLPPDKQIPDAMMNADLYVYFSDWVYLPQADTVRFHWDRLAVNPTNGPNSAMDDTALR
jgi:hypothetical protein